MNGVLDNSYNAQISNLNYNANRKFVIGHVDGGESSCTGCSFGGLIDEVLFYNRALSATEVDNIYTADLTAQTNEIEKTISSLAIFPNPVVEMLNINIETFNDSQENMIITIVNVLGETVGTYQLSKGNNAIDVEGLKSGVYFVSSDNHGTTKFVKK